MYNVGAEAISEKLSFTNGDDGRGRYDIRPKQGQIVSHAKLVVIFEKYSVALPYKDVDDTKTGLAAKEARALRAHSHMAQVSQNAPI